MKLTKTFKTYRTVGYTFSIPYGDPRSEGGVHHHQARFKDGLVEVRIVQTNGRFTSHTNSEIATPKEIAEIDAAK